MTCGFEKRKGFSNFDPVGARSEDLDTILCDDGSDGDYAPDILNPYSIRYSLDPSEYSCLLENKMRSVHKAQLKKSLIAAARVSGSVSDLPPPLLPPLVGPDQIFL